MVVLVIILLNNSSGGGLEGIEGFLLRGVGWGGEEKVFLV